MLKLQSESRIKFDKLEEKLKGLHKGSTHY